MQFESTTTFWKWNGSSLLLPGIASIINNTWHQTIDDTPLEYITIENQDQLQAVSSQQIHIWQMKKMTAMMMKLLMMVMIILKKWKTLFYRSTQFQKLPKRRYFNLVPLLPYQLKCFQVLLDELSLFSENVRRIIFESRKRNRTRMDIGENMKRYFKTLDDGLLSYMKRKVCSKKKKNIELNIKSGKTGKGEISILHVWIYCMGKSTKGFITRRICSLFQRWGTWLWRVFQAG